MGKGKGRVNIGVSATWYQKGGLGSDTGGLYLIDADGERRDIPVPPNGGQLIRLTIKHVNNGTHSFETRLFVADEQNHILVTLPIMGFKEVRGLDEVAQGAGLRYVERAVSDWTSGPGDFGFQKAGSTVNLDGVKLAQADRHSLVHLFHRGKRPSE